MNLRWEYLNPGRLSTIGRVDGLPVLLLHATEKVNLDLDSDGFYFHFTKLETTGSQSLTESVKCEKNPIKHLLHSTCRSWSTVLEHPDPETDGFGAICSVHRTEVNSQKPTTTDPSRLSSFLHNFRWRQLGTKMYCMNHKMSSSDRSIPALMTRYARVLHVLMVLLSAVCMGQESIVVKTEYGALRGRTRVLTNAAATPVMVNRFLGVPYARAPVGDLRFRPPQPPARWTQTRDATGTYTHIIQTAFYSDYSGSRAFRPLGLISSKVCQRS